MLLGPSACLRGELVMNGSPYRALLAVQGYMDRFTPSLIGGGQVYHRLLRARGPGVDEAILQCAGLLPAQRPLQCAPLIWRMETSAGSSFGLLARHDIWPRTLTSTVNLGNCLDTV